MAIVRTLASLLVFGTPIARLVEAKKRYVPLMGIGVGSLATNTALVGIDERHRQVVSRMLV